MFRFERLEPSEAIKEWLNNLDPAVRGLLTRKLQKFEEDKQFPNTAKLLEEVDGIGELKFHLGPGYRIYFCYYDQIVILLLCGGIKKNQRTDIKAAERIRKLEIERLERKKREEEGGKDGKV